MATSFRMLIRMGKGKAIRFSNVLTPFARYSDCSLGDILNLVLKDDQLEYQNAILLTFKQMARLKAYCGPAGNICSYSRNFPPIFLETTIKSAPHIPKGTIRIL